MSLLSAGFWKAAAERALKTFAQTLVALFTASVTILDIDWLQALGIAGTATLVSLLTSIASNRFGPFYGPSLTDEAVMVSTPNE
jgi:hypothetical protein